MDEQKEKNMSVGELPRVGQSKQATRKPAEPVEEVRVRRVKIEAPILDGLVLGYVSNRVDVTLTGSEAEAMARLRLALERQEATLESGKQVSTLSDVVRWVAQRLGGSNG